MSGSPLHSVSVAGVTFDDAGRVLVIKRRDNGEWQAPGGVLEPHETIEDGVIREVLEETGVTVSVQHLSGVYKNVSKCVLALVYNCQLITGQPGPTEESQEVAWMSVQDAMSLMKPAFAVRIEDAIPGRRRTVVSRAHDGTNLVDPV